MFQILLNVTHNVGAPHSKERNTSTKLVDTAEQRKNKKKTQ